MSDKISSKTIYTTHAVLSACDKLPDIWYQGSKAKDNAPVAPYNLIYTKAKQYFDIIIQVDAIEGSSTLDRLFGESKSGMLIAPALKDVEKDSQIASLTRIANKAKGKYVKDAIEEAITKESVKAELIDIGILVESSMKITEE